jgi:hypothetical protein
MIGTAMLVLFNLRPLMQDVTQVMRHAVTSILGSGHPRQTLAFGALWALIFALAAL